MYHFPKIIKKDSYPTIGTSRELRETLLLLSFEYCPAETILLPSGADTALVNATSPDLVKKIHLLHFQKEIDDNRTGSLKLITANATTGFLKKRFCSDSDSDCNSNIL